MEYFCEDGFDAFLKNERFHDVGIGDLRIPEIDDFIEELVDEDKIVLDGNFIEDTSKISFKQSDQLKINFKHEINSILGLQKS